MDELLLRKILNKHIKEICHYSQMQVFATSNYQKNYFQVQMNEVVDRLICLLLNNKREEALEQLGHEKETLVLQQLSQTVAPDVNVPIQEGRSAIEDVQELLSPIEGEKPVMY